MFFVELVLKSDNNRKMKVNKENDADADNNGDDDETWPK